MVTGTKPSDGDAHLTFFRVSEATPANYVLVVYKTTTTDIERVYVAGYKGDETAVSTPISVASLNTVKTGAWTLGVIDLTARMGEGAKLTSLRFDVCESTTDDESINFMSYALVDSLEGAEYKAFEDAYKALTGVK